MAKNVLMEEYHVTVYAPSKLKEAAYNAIHRTLTGKRFRAALGRAVEAVVRRHPSLHHIRISITR
jgi:hypothetical protein